MGSSGSTSSFEQNNWRKIESKKYRSILYNDITMKSVQQHQAVLDMHDDEIEEIYSWRSQLHPANCVIDLYEYGVKASGVCSGKSQIYAITERIHLLQNIGSYSKAEAFIILFDLSKAVQVLFQKFGPFTPRLDCIGVNSEGRAKCWIHENFAILQPRYQAIPVNPSELATVNNLIRLVDSKVYEDVAFPIEYPRNLNFQGVQKYVEEVFKNLQGFKVDRVYLDRIQFAKRYQQLRQFEQKQKQTLKMVSETQKRLKQIEELHKKLKMQQMELTEKQRQYQLAHHNHNSVNRITNNHKMSAQLMRANLGNTSQSQNKSHLQQFYHNQYTEQAKPKTSIDREIEMVDSMIVMHNEWENGQTS